MSSKALTVLAFVILGLLSVVIVVGLVQQTLNSTGVVTALTTIITGVLAGGWLREKDKTKGGDRE